MNDSAKQFLPRFSRCAALAACCCLAGVLAGNAAEDAEDAEEADDAVAEEVVVQELGPEVFDQWLFPRGNEQASRDDLQAQLAMRINDVDRICQLTDPQIQKLQLAGRMEMKRLFDAIASARRKFELQRKDQRNAGQIHQELQPLRGVFAQAFQDGSVFDKVAHTMLTAEQLPLYRRQLAERRLFHRRAQREMLLLALDKELPLREAQREKLLALWEEMRTVNPGQYELHALWFAASKLPAEKYEDILTDAQWKALAARFAPMQQLGLWLEQNGAFAEDRPEN